MSDHITVGEAFLQAGGVKAAYDAGYAQAEKDIIVWLDEIALGCFESSPIEAKWYANAKEGIENGEHRSSK